MQKVYAKDNISVLENDNIFIFSVDIGEAIVSRRISGMSLEEIIAHADDLAQDLLEAYR